MARATALIVHNEAAVDHVLTALRSLGRRVPRTCRCWRSARTRSRWRPPRALTNVRIPADEVGELAVRLLLDRLDGADVPEATLLPPALTDRASTAPPVAP